MVERQVAEPGLASRGVNGLQVGQSSEVHAMDERAVGDEDASAGVLELITNLTLTIAGVEHGRCSARERGGMESGGEFPGVGQEDADEIAGFDTSRNES